MAIVPFSTIEEVEAHNARVRAAREGRGNPAASDAVMQAARERHKGWTSASASRQAKQAAKAPALIRQSGKRPNKTEAAFENEILYWRRLRGEIAHYHAHDAVTLQLANGLRYTPDFRVIENDGRTSFYEVKATRRGKWNPVQDDAAAKIKMAAAVYPHDRFVLTWRQDGAWQEQEVKA